MSFDAQEWTIVLVAGKTLIGQLSGNGVLSPAYNLDAGMVPAPNGQIGCMLMVTPLLGFASIKSVTLPLQGCVVIPVSSLSKREQSELAKGVERCTELLGAMRAQQSGIVLATGMVPT